MINAQTWLDKEYPKETRNKIKEIHLTEPNLVGELDLGDFTYQGWDSSVNVYIYPQVDETKLTFKNKPENAEIIPLIAQRYLNYHYPQEQRKQIKELDIWGKELEGELNLNDFISLEKLNCFGNKLTSLEINNCEQLKELECYNNQVTQLILPEKLDNLEKLDCHNNLLTDLDFNSLGEKLTYLNLSNNNFSTRDLSCLVRFNKLERLVIGNNHFYGSLEPLQNLSKLEYLDISNTDLNEGAEYLPKSLKKIRYSTDKRPDCKLTALIPWLDKHFGEFDRCLKCGLTNTSENWCQPCAEKEWQKDLKNLTGQELVEKFIQQQGKDWEGKPKLQWIPYQEFTNLEYLAKGGFSKIYKAKWKREEGGGLYYTYKLVVLKSLTNSNTNNITLEFLTEITNTKLVDTSRMYSNIVQCYGISQDPKTKNYVMVMQYMKDGNLREYLKNNYRELSWEDKLRKLWYIAEGLERIHEQNLVHRDFHSGNILNSSEWASYITDLGLSKLVNFQTEVGKIMGVLPYVAPEVLQGQPYTKESDIYSFGIIAYELLSGLPPYYDQEHDVHLSLKICQGLRPTFKVKIPTLLEELINKCWNTNPEQRPNARELERTLNNWRNKINNPFIQQAEEAKEYNQSLPESIRFPKYEIHPGAVYHSKPINTKLIVALLRNSKNQQEALELELKKMQQELGKSFTDEQKKLVSKFIRNWKKLIENKKDEEAKKETRKIERKLENEGFTDENIEKIINYCKRLVKLVQQLENEEKFQTNIEAPPKK